MWQCREKIKNSKGCANRKGWIFHLNIPCQVHHNSNRNSLLCSTGRCSAQWWEFFFFFEKLLMGWSIQHHHPYWKQSPHTHRTFKPISTMFWEWKEEHPDFKMKIGWNMHHKIQQKLIPSYISQSWYTRNLFGFCRRASSQYLLHIQL